VLLCNSVQFSLIIDNFYLVSFIFLIPDMNTEYHDKYKRNMKILHFYPAKIMRKEIYRLRKKIHMSMVNCF